MDFVLEQRVMCTWLWDESRNKCQSNLKVLMQNIKEQYNYDNDQLVQLKAALNKNFIVRFNRYWTNVKRERTAFEKKHTDFLDRNFRYKFKSEESENESPNENSAAASYHVPQQEKKKVNKGGRPKLGYKDSSLRTQQRRIQQLRQNYTQEELAKAIIKPVIGQKKDFDDDTLSKTLAMIKDVGLSRNQYETLRAHLKIIKGTKVLVPYKQLETGKQQCYPANIEISEQGASVDLQSLLDHTASRIIETLPKEDLKKFDGEELILSGKWGLDGASGQQTFKQNWLSSTDVPATSDSSVFMISYVPLNIVSFSQEVLWKNLRSSSVRLCRPIKFEFAKETTEKIQKEYADCKGQIENLNPTYIDSEDKTYVITHKLHSTMIDGKVCNALTEQKSSTSCNICKATPNQMNDLETVKKLTINEEHYQFGLSTLHCRIRFMECVLHIAYNLDFKKSIAKGADKDTKEQKKRNVQDELRTNLGIIVDVVRQGHGSTNDGNTARRFFDNPVIVSPATGVDQTLIERFSNILAVMTSGLEIDCEKFEEYALDTAQLYVELYGWYKMPPSVHKVLIHGSKIIQAFGLPIGSLSEEAQEANNKVFKEARAKYSRKCGRKQSNEDIIHHLLISSDPYVSSLRRKSEKNSKELTAEAKSLLTCSIESDED